MLALMAIEIKYGALAMAGPKHPPVMYNVSGISEGGLPVRARSDSVPPRTAPNPSTPFNMEPRTGIVHISRRSVVVIPPKLGPNARAGLRRSNFIPGRTSFRSPFERTAPYRRGL
jgi:hypothetical protein